VGRESITRGCEALSETVRYVVGTEETDKNIPQMKPHDRKYRSHDRGKDVAFETHQRAVAAGKKRTSVTYA
jgi:hypothetical protein